MIFTFNFAIIRVTCKEHESSRELDRRRWREDDHGGGGGGGVEKVTTCKYTDDEDDDDVVVLFVHSFIDTCYFIS